MPFAGSIVPKGWALCNGALLAIQTNSALFTLLGTYYGGDGVRTFALPDLRGRALLGSTGASGAYPVGLTSGSVQITLNPSQLPQHNHLVQVTTTAGAGRSDLPAGKIFGTNSSPPNAPKQIFVTAGSGETPLSIGTNIANEGSSWPHNNLQPYLTISYLIALQGIYPSRD